MKQTNTIAARKAQKGLTEQTLSREEFVISRFLSELAFPPRLWGVDEDAVWRTLEKLTALYEEALTVERCKRELAQRQLEALRCRMEEGISDG